MNRNVEKKKKTKQEKEEKKKNREKIRLFNKFNRDGTNCMAAALLYVIIILLS